MIILLARGTGREIKTITPMLPLTAIDLYDGNLDNIVKKGENWCNYIIAYNNKGVDVEDFLRDDNDLPIYEE